MVFFPYLEISLTAWSANWVFVKWNLKRQKRFCIVSTAACSVVRACCTASVQCDKQTVTSFACRHQAVAPVAKVVKLASCDHGSGSGPAFFEQEELSTVCWTAWMTCGLGTKAGQGCGWCRLAAVLLPLHPGWFECFTWPGHWSMPSGRCSSSCITCHAVSNSWRQ